MKNKCNFATNSREVHEKSNLRKGNVRSTCWKLKNHARLLVSRVPHEKGQPVRYSRNSLPRGFYVQLSSPSPILFIPSLSTKVRETIQREKP